MSPLLRLLIVCFSLTLMAGATSVMAEEQDHGLTDAELEAMEFDIELEYYVRLVNGDIVSGPITETSTDTAGAYIRIKTPFGRARVYASEIAWVSLKDDAYRSRNRGLILPTAEGIKRDHYIALVQGVMPTIGIGIGDIVSVTGGRTVVPGIGWQNQFSTVNIKGTLYEDSNGLVEGGKQIYALGVNGSWINDANFMGHIYGVATFTGKRTRVSTIIHAKVAGKDSYLVEGGTFFSPFTFPYSNGTIGVAFMLDVRFPAMHDLHFLGELWNADLTRPSQSALFLGLRQCNTTVTFDFGLTIVPGPNVVPALAIAWTPF